MILSVRGRKFILNVNRLQLCFDYVRAAALAVVTCVALSIQALYSKFSAVPERSIRGKVVLLTGAAVGLGRSLALQLSARGCVVACVDVNQKDNEKTVELVRALAKNPAAARAYKADIADRGQVHRAVRKIMADFGRIDILVNNAAIVSGKKILDYNDLEIDTTIDINFKALVTMVREVLPGMRSRGSGHIVAISSITAYLGVGNLSVYSGTKGAVTAFMEALYDELRNEPILVTTVHPHVINTHPAIDKILKVRLPILETDGTAREIVDAVVAGKVSTFIPAHFGIFVGILMALPHAAMDTIRSVFYVFAHPTQLFVDNKPAFTIGDAFPD